MAYEQLRYRLREGRPLVLAADTQAALRGRGLNLDAPGALGALLQRSPHDVCALHEAELTYRADVLCALTSDTSPRCLAEAGMEHRSARLTGVALELVFDLLEQAHRPVAVAGVLGSDQVSATIRERFEGETDEHAARISAAGAELMIARGTGSRLDLVFAVASASAQELPVWAVVDGVLGQGHSLAELVGSLADAGAEAILFEVASVDEGLERLSHFRETKIDEVAVGTLLSAAPDALRGFPSPLYAHWVDRVIELTDAGARIVGGGAGTTEAHTRALAERLGIIHPSIPAQPYLGSVGPRDTERNL